MMKKSFLFDKIIDLDTTGKKNNIIQNLTGINHVANDFLNAFLLSVAQEANIKEVAQYANLLEGKGNVFENILNIGGGILEQEMNKKKDKEKVDGEKSDNDPVKSILDILGGGKKKKEKEQIKETPKEEEKKKKDPINKKDDLIKKIDDIFK